MSYKKCVDGARERVVQWSYIYQHVPHINKATPTSVVSYPARERICNGSLGAQYTRADNVLFYMEGNCHILLLITMPHISATYQDFNHIIIGYCRGYIGSHYVERGEYNLIATDGYKRIGPIEFAQEVNPGVVLEMSIVLRHETAYNRETCPRCHHINLSLAVHDGWIAW